MKATIVLIADNDAENYGRRLMLEAHKHGKMGVFVYEKQLMLNTNKNMKDF